MISHRLRAVIAGLPIVAVSTVLIASPGFAAESLRISTPLAGTTVSGQLLIEGSIAGDTAVDVDLGLGPQSLGECGAPIVEARVELASSAFATNIATTAVPDGTYCLIAIADAGRLSTVVADITVDNAALADEPLEGFQLPTMSLDESDAPAAAAPTSAVLLADPAVIAPIVLAATAGLAGLVLGLGLWARRRTAR